MKTIFTLFSLFLLTFSMSAQSGTLVLELDKIKSNEGKILVALYDSEQNWLDRKEAVYSAVADATKGVMKIEIPDVKFGTYGIALLHDEDGNGDMTTNFMGIPKEDFGFSNINKMIFSEPDFGDTAITIGADPVRIRML